MSPTVQFLVRHGYAVLFLSVAAEQIGLPIPAVPVLLAAGALAGAGTMGLPAALGVALVATLMCDGAWYEVGRRRGAAVLRVLCRISLEPDSCVRRTESSFARYGSRSLVVAKFIPGVGAVAPPLAGMFHMRASRFLVFDTAGALVWAGAYLGVGFVFSGQIERLADHAALLGSWLVVLLVALAAGYIARKLHQRRRFLRELRVARITPQELKAKLDAGENVVVVDLRHRLDFEADPRTIPGAISLSVEDFEERWREIPADREVVLFCT